MKLFGQCADEELLCRVKYGMFLFFRKLMIGRLMERIDGYMDEFNHKHDNLKWGSTRSSGILPSKHEGNTLQIKERKKYRKNHPLFALEITARSATDILRYPSQSRSPILPQNPPSHSCHLHWLTIRSFTVLLNLTKAVSTAAEKENTDAVRQESSYFDILKRHGKVYIRQLRTITNPISGWLL